MWIQNSATPVSVDKDGYADIYVWAESPSGKTKIMVKVILKPTQIDALAAKLAEQRARYGIA